ncbi:hypothetical protein NA56DRAFT_710340 [Hyaloscypha hepaticicola]|uniref:Uncharacterized protein n=1 Tax=Hyaloscypha hepaticicola TaxID=2082293 RepID=A0A2J6PM65_9HELO|nr:hypothetical protein NA56DRAFT_710340 [Hyaloscypha hepaticicola]
MINTVLQKMEKLDKLNTSIWRRVKYQAWHEKCRKSTLEHAFCCKSLESSSEVMFVNTASKLEIEIMNVGFCFWRRSEHVKRRRRCQQLGHMLAIARIRRRKAGSFMQIPVFAVFVSEVCMTAFGLLLLPMGRSE